MPITPKIKMPTKLKSQAETAIAQHGDDVRILMNSAPQARNAFNSLFTVFINKKIVSKDLSNLYNDFIQFVDFFNINYITVLRKINKVLRMRLRSSNEEGINNILPTSNIIS